MLYENESIGNIIIVKNLIFEDKATGKSVVDHSWKEGRPCLIIHSDDEYDYFLTLTTSDKKSKGFDKYYYTLTEEDMLFEDRKLRYDIQKPKRKDIKKKEKSKVNLQEIYKKPISGNDQIGKIKLETLEKIIENLTRCQNLKEEQLKHISKKIGGR